MPLSSDDIKEIAKAMVHEIKATNHDFWIDPQEHYDEHQAVREMVKSWGDAKSIFTRAFIGLVVIGGFVVMGIAVMKGVVMK